MIHLVLPTESVFFWATVFASLSIVKKLRALQSGISCLCLVLFFSFCGESFVLHTLVHFFDNVFNGNQSIQESICVIHWLPLSGYGHAFEYSQQKFGDKIYICSFVLFFGTSKEYLEPFTKCRLSYVYFYNIYYIAYYNYIYIFQTEFVLKTPLESN